MVMSYPSGVRRIGEWFEWQGRMAEPEDIILAIEENLAKQLPLKTKTFLSQQDLL